jgi:hypothetical protein
MKRLRKILVLKIQSQSRAGMVYFIWQGRFGNYAWAEENRFVFNTSIATIRNNNSNPLIALMKDQVDRKQTEYKPVLSIVLKQKLNGNIDSIKTIK